jgi:hypothetical protein
MTKFREVVDTIFGAYTAAVVTHKKRSKYRVVLDTWSACYTAVIHTHRPKPVTPVPTPAPASTVRRTKDGSIRVTTDGSVRRVK